jgi:hypothetical protein
MRPWLKPFLVGFGGALAALCLAGLVLVGYLVWTGARHGEAAFEYINQVIQSQQRQAQPPQRPSSPPDK